jgi:hypothetical protein
MKHLILGSLITIILASGVSSCKKCYSCDFGGGDVREYCSKDFPDKTAGLKMTIDAYQARGYKCTAK